MAKRGKMARVRVTRCALAVERAKLIEKNTISLGESRYSEMQKRCAQSWLMLLMKSRCKRGDEVDKLVRGQ